MRTLDVKGVAEFLNVHTKTVQSLASTGALPGAKIGRAWVFLEDDVQSYIRGEIDRQVKSRLDNSSQDNKIELPEEHGRGSRRRRRKIQLPELPEAFS